MADRAVRREPAAAARSGLPHAWLAERGRGRGAGSVAAPEPYRDEYHREPGWLVDDRRLARVSGHAARAEVTARRTDWRAGHRVERRAWRSHRSRRRSDARRLGWRGTACRARHAHGHRTPCIRPA